MLPHETSFNAPDNSYTNEEFFNICEDYGVPHDPSRYRDEKFYWTYLRSVIWLNDYIGLDSMTRWIISTRVLPMWDCLECWRVSEHMHI